MLLSLSSVYWPNITRIISNLKVHTAQNVLLELPLANAGQRLVSALIDTIAIVLYFILSSYIVEKAYGESAFESFNIIANLIILLPIMFYIPLTEYFWGGRTIGKFFLKLRVLRTDGSAASLGDITLRWLLRTIDLKIGFLLFFFLPDNPSSEIEESLMIAVYVFMVLPLPIVGIISMLVTKHNQRIGDLVANTVVVHNKRLFSLDDTILKSTAEDYQPVFTNVLQLGDKDIYIIKNVLDNAEKSKDKKAIIDLAQKARQILKIENEMPARQLLQTLLKDYNYLAKKKDEVL